MLLVPGFTPSPVVRAMINIGALLDIPTGLWHKGIHGENILNGGLGAVTGMVGIGNNFKSTALHYMLLSALSRIVPMFKTNLSTYDTEINTHEAGLLRLTEGFEEFKGKNLFDEQLWTLTDATIYDANKWFEIFKDFLKDKTTKNKKELEVDSPFIDRDGKLMKMLVPTFGEVDSLTEFKTDSEKKLLDDNELGESGANTFHMRAGLVKTRFLMELPALVGGAYHYIGLVGQLGKEGPAMQQGPMAPPPTKKLQFLKHGDKIKGTTDKFLFATNNCWHSYNASPLINQSTKAAEYPTKGADPISGDTDLMLVSLRLLRGKSGMSGIVINLVVSQLTGILPGLTEFHFLKETDRYGISGTLQHYALDLYPDCKLQRTTVRSKIEEDAMLRRALNITAEMLQMKLFHRIENMPTPKELYEKLKEKGYDWNILLATRGWWTINNDQHPTPFLSTKDLLEMYEGNYHPYWLDDKDFTKIKKQHLPK